MGLGSVGVRRKSELRRSVWDALSAAGAARFPGVRGRIPNFVGAEAAARRLTASRVWKDAAAIKANPDSPQRPVRHAALLAGKTVFMAVPRLRAEAPFLELRPARLGAGALWVASSIKGATQLGVPVTPARMPRIDLVVTGCVGVSRDGTRLGKGGGYSDLEYAVLREAGRVDEATPIVTTVHPVQLLPRAAIPRQPHDITLDLAATPERVVRIRGRAPRPEGVLWDALPDEELDAIPFLRARRPAR